MSLTPEATVLAPPNRTNEKKARKSPTKLGAGHGIQDTQQCQEANDREAPHDQTSGSNG